MTRLKTISAIGIKEKTLENMLEAIKKYNKKNIFPVTKTEFRRMSIELLSQLILQDKDIPVDLTLTNSN